MSTKDDLTTRENEVLALAWQCFEQEPKVNMVKLAGLTGYTPGSAAFTMGKIKRKLKNKTASVSADSPAQKSTRGRPRTAVTPKSTPKSTPSKRGATSKANVDDTPSKRQKKAQATSFNDSASPSATDDEDEDFAGLGARAAKIKKEEGFGSPVREEERPTRRSYGFLDGIENFGGAPFEDGE